MTFSTVDSQMMSRALQLAERGRYTTRPNPRVGCVIAVDDQIVAEGWHYRAGEPHAEIHALNAAERAHASVLGATVYVTLEPCSHQGRTGACSIALIKAGIGRLVYALEDPNPRVSGSGLQMLREAGISVDGPLLQQQAHALNAGFIKRMQQQRPFVTCKLASSLDGRTAMASGESQWITGSAARHDVQRLRAQSCAVITGIGSILQDNSRLNLRADELSLSNANDVVAHPPLRVVLESHLQMSSGAAIFASAGKVVVFISEMTPAEKVSRWLSSMTEAKASVVIEKVAPAASGVDLLQVLTVLAQRYECNDILLEAGATLSGSFLQAGLIDQCVFYQAPIIMGSDARALFNLPLEKMKEKIALTIVDIRQINDDLRITAEPVLPKQE